MILVPMVNVVTPPCVLCKKGGEVTMPRAAYFRFTQGAMVQDAWPQGSDDEREQLINGTHPECFDILFGDEEDDE